VSQRLIEPIPDGRLAAAEGLAGATGAAPPASLPQRGRTVFDAIAAGAQELWSAHPVLVTVGLLTLFSLLRLALYVLIAGGHGGFAHAICKYDCYWYQDTARHGYDLTSRGDPAGNTANWAFFPLYPMLLGVFAALRLGDPALTAAGVVISTACFVAFGTLGALYLRHTAADRAKAEGFAPLLAWLGFLTLWPGTLYFSMPYSEALYALLMTASLFALIRRRPVNSAIGCALLDATRPTGLLMVPVIAVERLRMLWSAWQSGALRRDPIGYAASLILPLAIAPLGLVGFVAYLYWHVGDGLAFGHVQAAWHRHSLPPWDFLWEGLAAHDWSQIFASPAHESLSIEAAVGILGLVLALRQTLVGRYAEAWLIGASILMASTAGLQSLPRFLLTNPITILALFRILRGSFPPRAFWAVTLVLGAFQLLMMLGWYTNAPILS
jgi:Mannosyltransferase (PIG-V)